MNDFVDVWRHKFPCRHIKIVSIIFIRFGAIAKSLKFRQFDRKSEDNEIDDFLLKFDSHLDKLQIARQNNKRAAIR